MPIYEYTDRPTAQELLNLPVLCRSQADNLHYEDEDNGVRFWLSRCGIADGEPYEHTVTIETRHVTLNYKREVVSEGWKNYVRYDGGPLEDD